MARRRRRRSGGERAANFRNRGHGLRGPLRQRHVAFIGEGAVLGDLGEGIDVVGERRCPVEPAQHRGGAADRAFVLHAARVHRRGARNEARHHGAVHGVAVDDLGADAGLRRDARVLRLGGAVDEGAAARAGEAQHVASGGTDDLEIAVGEAAEGLDAKLARAGVAEQGNARQRRQRRGGLHHPSHFAADLPRRSVPCHRSPVGCAAQSPSPLHHSRRRPRPFSRASPPARRRSGHGGGAHMSACRQSLSDCRETGRHGRAK